MTVDTDQKPNKQRRRSDSARKSASKNTARNTAKNTGGVRFALSIAGYALMLLSPIIGALPGPGFIIMFPLGLALVLQNSHWAKRRYVDFKRRFPKYGKWTDWAMRRKRHRELPEDFELPILGKVKTKSEG